MAQLRQTPGSTPLTELHEPFMGYLQLGGLDSLEIGQTEACTVGLPIRNPLAGDSMQRSLHQTLSDLTMAMTDACNAREPLRAATDGIQEEAVFL